jgi:hypothetical protein
MTERNPRELSYPLEYHKHRFPLSGSDFVIDEISFEFFGKNLGASTLAKHSIDAKNQEKRKEQQTVFPF